MYFARFQRARQRKHAEMRPQNRSGWSGSSTWCCYFSQDVSFTFVFSVANYASMGTKKWSSRTAYWFGDQSKTATRRTGPDLFVFRTECLRLNALVQIWPPSINAPEQIYVYPPENRINKCIAHLPLEKHSDFDMQYILVLRWRRLLRTEEDDFTWVFGEGSMIRIIYSWLKRPHPIAARLSECMNGDHKYLFFEFVAFVTTK